MPNRYTPPFAGLTGYADALGSLVKDRRASREDVDLVSDALELFADDVPVNATADVGDGSAREWELGASPFGAWSLGFSETRSVRVERLAASAPQNPQEWLRQQQHRIEERTVSGTQKVYLVLDEAPPASPSQYRVHFRRRWTVGAATNEVRLGFQMSVVYLAAALKCEALAAAYANTRTEATELFNGLSAADAWAQRAKDFRALYARALRGNSRGLTSAQVRTGRGTVFGRGYGV